MNYRPELDGLRAIAVLSVVLFHGGVPWISGGFLGVDVFFVISGYLITRILLEDFANDCFSLLSFYERRARRILPALFFVVACCVPASFLIMSVAEFRVFSQSIVATLAFLSNIFFWQNTGYFSPTSDTMPLLHTWSLAVEEQFYIAFPIILFALYNHINKKILLFLAVATGFSLALSEWAAHTYPSANFYLPITRAWELLAGALTAYALHDRERLANETLATIGFAGLIGSITYLNQNDALPGLLAIVPVGGTVLLILYADHSKGVGRLLSTRPMIAIGLISYSVYLWHHPLFSFSRLHFDGTPPQAVMAMLVVASIAMGAVSWKFVEQPFRRKGGISQLSTAALGSFSAACLVLVGIIGSTGLLDRPLYQLRYQAASAADLDRYRLAMQSINYDLYDHMVSEGCYIWRRSPRDLDIDALSACHEMHGKAVVVLGDSHAMNLHNIVAKSEVYSFIIGISVGGCRPHDNYEHCPYDAFNEFLRENGEMISTVVFHQSGSHFARNQSGEVGMMDTFHGAFDGIDYSRVDQVAAYLTQLSASHDVPIQWIGPFLEYRHDPEDIILGQQYVRVNPNSVSIFKQLNFFLADRFVGRSDWTYASFETYFFQPSNAFVDDCLVFRDGDHYSLCGEAVIADLFRGFEAN